MALVWALLQNKKRSTYLEMFTAVRDALVEGYGDVGCQRCFLVDFELAAIDAIGAVFVDAKVKGCTFHFHQAVMRRVTDEGLRPAYCAHSPPQVKLKNKIILIYLTNYEIKFVFI